jgi:hypothetical protein
VQAQALKVMIENVEMEKRRIPPSLPCLEAKILSKHKIASCHLCGVQLFFFFWCNFYGVDCRFRV